MPEDYRVQLVPEECAPGGVFHALHCWLDANMARYGFFRPYRTFRGGVLPEPWHLSYAPASVPALETLTPELLAEAIASSDMLGKEIVLRRLDDIHAALRGERRSARDRRYSAARDRERPAPKAPQIGPDASCIGQRWTPTTSQCSLVHDRPWEPVAG